MYSLSACRREGREGRIASRGSVKMYEQARSVKSTCTVGIPEARSMAWTAHRPRRLKRPRPAARPELTEEQEASILLAACRRVAAAVRRRAGRNRPAGCWATSAKTHVYGAFVTLRRDGQLRSCCGHLGPAVSLWQRVGSRGRPRGQRRPAISADRAFRVEPTGRRRLDSLGTGAGHGPRRRPRRRGGDRQARPADRAGLRTAGCCCRAWRSIMDSTRRRSCSRSASRPACPPTPGRTTTPR